MEIKQLGVLVGLIAGIGLMLISFIGFALTGQVAYYIFAVTDDSVWTNDLKYIDTTLTGTNLTADANQKEIYALAVTQRDTDLANLSTILSVVNIVIGLIGLVVVITVFFMNGGVLDMIRGRV